MTGRNYHATGTGKYRFGFNKGSENDDEISGSGNYITTLYREGDNRLGNWWSFDPKANRQPWQSPFTFMGNNPIINIDPLGDLENPIYGTDGGFLGTDDKGVKGEAIVMDKSNFKQGMSNKEALDKGTLRSKMPLVIRQSIFDKIDQHVANLPKRPDYDGYVSIKEGITWAKSHPNLDDDKDESNGLGKAKPNDWLYVDASKLNFGNMAKKSMELNEITEVNLLYHTFYDVEASVATTYALGRTKLRLLDANGTVEVINGPWNIYNWDKGGGNLRKSLITLERMRAGLNDTHGFPLYIYGQGKLNW